MNRLISLPMLAHAARTALASVATLALTHALGLTYGYWAVISTIIVMQSHLGGSIRAAMRRVIGTCIGACVAIAFLLFGKATLLSLGLAVFVTLALSALMTRAHETFRMAGVTAGIVLLAWSGQGSPLWFGVERMAEIFIGVSVALVVSLFLWPSRAVHRLREEIRSELEGLAGWTELSVDLFLGFAEEDGEARSGALLNRLHSARELRDLTVQESALLRARNADLLAAVGSLERIFGLCRGLSRISATATPEGYQQLLKEELIAVGHECSSLMRLLGRRFQPDEGQQPDHPSRLPVAVETLEDRMNELRLEKGSSRYSLMEVADVYAFAQTLKALAVELEWLALRTQTI